MYMRHARYTALEETCCFVHTKGFTANVIITGKGYQWQYAIYGTPLHRVSPTELRVKQMAAQLKYHT